MKRARLAKKTVVTGFIAGMMASTPAMAGVISGWDMSNVTVAPAPYTSYVTYLSTLFTNASKTATNGAITWKETDVKAPGKSSMPTMWTAPNVS